MVTAILAQLQPWQVVPIIVVGISFVGCLVRILLTPSDDIPPLKLAAGSPLQVFGAAMQAAPSSGDSRRRRPPAAPEPSNDTEKQQGEDVNEVAQAVPVEEAAEEVEEAVEVAEVVEAPPSPPPPANPKKSKKKAPAAAVAAPAPQAAPAAPVEIPAGAEETPEQKAIHNEIRKHHKKLREISDLKARQADGHPLTDSQLEKIGGETALLEVIAAAEAKLEALRSKQAEKPVEKPKEESSEDAEWVKVQTETQTASDEQVAKELQAAYDEEAEVEIEEFQQKKTRRKKKAKKQEEPEEVEDVAPEAPVEVVEVEPEEEEEVAVEEQEEADEEEAEEAEVQEEEQEEQEEQEEEEEEEEDEKEDAEGAVPNAEEDDEEEEEEEEDNEEGEAGEDAEADADGDGDGEEVEGENGAAGDEQAEEVVEDAPGGNADEEEEEEAVEEAGAAEEEAPDAAPEAAAEEEEEEPCTPRQHPPTEKEKQIMKFKKTLREIDQLLAKQAEGGSLAPNQQAKVSKKAGIEEELSEWEKVKEPHTIPVIGKVAQVEEPPFGVMVKLEGKMDLLPLSAAYMCHPPISLDNLGEIREKYPKDKEVTVRVLRDGKRCSEWDEEKEERRWKKIEAMDDELKRMREEDQRLFGEESEIFTSLTWSAEMFDGVVKAVRAGGVRVGILHAREVFIRPEDLLPEHQIHNSLGGSSVKGDTIKAGESVKLYIKYSWRQNSWGLLGSLVKRS